MADMRPFTHRIFSDFSGDDGDPGVAGASRTLCITWVITKEEDIWHNQGVVLGIKRTIGCRPDAELKYRSLRHHPSRRKALALLSEAKVEVILVPVFKERVKEEDLKDPKTKRLVSLIHYVPIGPFSEKFFKRSDTYFQLVFDEVGWAGCEEAIRAQFQRDKRLDWKKARADWLLFTKSGSSLMLQLADVIAGLGREYVESLLGQRLPTCVVCWLKGVRACSYIKAGRSVGRASLMRLLYPLLLKDDGGKAWESGFTTRPPGVQRDYLFIDCLFGGK
ncbi:MAG: hypothetical protein KJ624_08100 [Chloroflexi bacterium]|nr:hypothetical protein [Chloroflexota bacterium]